MVGQIMKKSEQTKVHTRIGHDRALCGVNPNRGHYTILSNAAFVATQHAERCGKCANLYRKHGYSIDIPVKSKASRKTLHRRATAASYREQA